MNLALGIVAGIASKVATDLAPPDGDEGARVAIRATPRQDVAVGSLDNGVLVTGALVGHSDCSLKCCDSNDSQRSRE